MPSTAFGAGQPEAATDSRDDRGTPDDAYMPSAMTFASFDNGARPKQLVRLFAELLAADIKSTPTEEL